MVLKTDKYVFEVKDKNFNSGEKQYTVLVTVYNTPEYKIPGKLDEEEKITLSESKFEFSVKTVDLPSGINELDVINIQNSYENYILTFHKNGKLLCTFIYSRTTKLSMFECGKEDIWVVPFGNKIVHINSTPSKKQPFTLDIYRHWKPINEIFIKGKMNRIRFKLMSANYAKKIHYIVI